MRRGKNNPMFGRKHTEETKKNWSKKRKGTLKGEKNGMHGKCHSTEARDRIRASRAGTILIYNPATGQRKFVQAEDLKSWEFAGWNKAVKKKSK